MPGKDLEHFEKWACFNARVSDTSAHQSFDENYLHPQESADIKVRLVEMFVKELGGEAELEKLYYLLLGLYSPYICIMRT